MRHVCNRGLDGWAVICWVFREWNPTHLYGDDFINHEIRITILNNQNFMVQLSGWLSFRGSVFPQNQLQKGAARGIFVIGNNLFLFLGLSHNSRQELQGFSRCWSSFTRIITTSRPTVHTKNKVVFMWCNPPWEFSRLGNCYSLTFLTLERSCFLPVGSLGSMYDMFPYIWLMFMVYESWI